MTRQTEITVPPRDARRAAVDVLARQLPHFPDMPLLQADTSQLKPDDHALAEAIHRTTLQRLLTLQHVIQEFTDRPMAQMQPALAATLLSAAAQLLMFDRLPGYAVVDEAVNIAKLHVHRGAGGLVNAVLRKLLRMIEGRDPQAMWHPQRNVLPMARGVVHLKQDVLPPMEDLTEHLAAAFSIAPGFVEHWLAQFGHERTAHLLHHSLHDPPTILRLPPGSDQPLQNTQPHVRPGFALWQGGGAGLQELLQNHPQITVQDPASAQPVLASGIYQPQLICDYCAGVGTKTRQLAELHPQARILAHDPSSTRITMLRQSLQRLPDSHAQRIEIVEPAALESYLGKVDLLLLDVPCSNTATLNRRWEARYRDQPEHLEELVELQRRIIRNSLPLLRDTGQMLYSTCSLLRQENHEQVAWIEDHTQMRCTNAQLILPALPEQGYHDGTFFAVFEANQS